MIKPLKKRNPSKDLNFLYLMLQLCITKPYGLLDMPQRLFQGDGEFIRFPVLEWLQTTSFMQGAN